MSFKIAIEGNVGSGKSTLLEYFSSSYGYSVYPEPVADWQNSAGSGMNYLREFYKNPERNAFAFQLLVLQSLYERDRVAKGKHQVFERTIASGKNVFLPVLKQKEIINNFEEKVYDEIFSKYEWDLAYGIDLYIFLKADPKICLERIARRSRSEERNISEEYLKDVQTQLDSWENELRLNGSKILVIDSNKRLSEMFYEYERIDSEIFNSG